MTGLSVRRSLAGYAVFRGSCRVSVVYSHQYCAEERLDAIAREDRLKERPCICCGTTIESEGPHHRMCQDCRSRGRSGIVSGWTGGKVLARRYG